MHKRGSPTLAPLLFLLYPLLPLAPGLPRDRATPAEQAHLETGASTKMPRFLLLTVLCLRTQSLHYDACQSAVQACFDSLIRY